MPTSRDLPHDVQLDYFRIADHSPRTHLFSLSTPRIWIAGSWRRTSYRYSVGLVPQIRRNTRAAPVRKGPAARRRRRRRPSLARFRLCVALSEGGFSSVGHLDPLRVRRGLGVVVVVPVPPLVWRSLWIALRGVLPLLLASERRYIKITPGAPHRLVGAIVDEVGAEHLVAVADECIVAVPLVHAEVGVEGVCDGVPRHLPAHSCLQALDVLLWRARGVRQRGVAGVQMRQVGDLIGAQGAAAAGVLGPAEHPGLEEGAIDDQLTAALEQIDQAYLALGSVELVLLVHSQPRHPPALGGQRVTRAGQGLLLHEQLLARSLPFLRRHDRRCVHSEMSFPVFLVSLLACCHLISPLFSETDRDDSFL